jgi:phosphoribosylaminoimidazole-succinocarboxamide synthase
MPIPLQILSVNDDLPIRTEKPIHSGKVRSVYWLTSDDSQRLIEQKSYDVPLNTPLAIMVISDRISAFDCIWSGQGGMKGVPGKGAALNAISNHWFEQFKQHGLADSHILDIPHPLVWIVQKAQPVMIEAICRGYITGSMWRAYESGERLFCGIQLPENLGKDSQLDNVLITPSTKGILKGIPSVPEVDDTNVTKQDIIDNYSAFGFKSQADIELYEVLLKQGFDVIRGKLAELGQIFVDTKFEFGYVTDRNGNNKLIYMDEVGTPDSSRIWDAEQYHNGKIMENSKEGFRQLLLNHFSDPDILLNKDRMVEREALARDNELPQEVLLDVSKTYLQLAERITGRKIPLSDDPRTEIIEILGKEYGLIS